jgi:predicted ATP-grasp superfamily ATP-dependent carboligase
MTSLGYLRGERNIKVRSNYDRRLLSTKISELQAQTDLKTVEEVTFNTLKIQTKLFAKKVNYKPNAQELINGC